MLTPVSHATWQVLRAVLRNQNKPTPGWHLRLNITRRTRDGAFLTALVTDGLLSVVPGGHSPPPADAEVNEALRQHEPFHATYTLTPRGRYAAEYGEFDDGQVYA